jgi:hypothetical protein
LWSLFSATLLKQKLLLRLVQLLLEQANHSHQEQEELSLLAQESQLMPGLGQLLLQGLESLLIMLEQQS